MAMNSDNSNNSSSPDRADDENIHNLSTLKLFQRIEKETRLLIRREIDLAKTEFRAEIRSESFLAAGFVVGIAAGSIGGILLLVTAIFALSLVFPGWAAGLIVSGVMMLISGIGFLFGWSRRIRQPLTRTREVLNADRHITGGHSEKHAA